MANLSTTVEYFEAGAGPYSGGNVGTANENGGFTKVVCRVRFTTDGHGATKLSFKTTNATATVRGAPSSDDGVGRLRFAVGTGADTYVGYQGNGGYAITDFSYGRYVAGSLSYNFQPNTTYYLWIFPSSGFPSYTRFALGGCTVTASGTYGTASTITAGNGSFGSDIPVTLSNSVSGVTHTLTVSCGGITKTLLSGSGSMSATWTPSLSEYGPAITNAASATATFTCTTQYGGASWGTSTKTITVSFPSSAGPSISSAGVTYDNSDTAASAITAFVQGYSKARATITAAGKYGAGISSYALTVGGATVSRSASPLTSAAVTASGSITATLKVTDSRGFTASVTRSFTVQPYARPSITGASLYRCDAGGAASDAGTCLRAYGVGNIASLSGQNTMTMTVAYKTAAGSYGEENAMQSGTAKILTGLSADVSYTARITLTDRLGNSAAVTAAINSQKWAMKFNSSGTAVGFGTAPQAAKVLEIPTDWSIRRGTAKALFDSGGTMTGYLRIDMGNPGVLLQNTSATDGTPPSQNNNSIGFRLRDKNNANIMLLTDYWGADGRQGAWLAGYNKGVTNALLLLVDGDGNRSVSVTSPAAWRSALGLGSVLTDMAAKSNALVVESRSTDNVSVSASGAANIDIAITKSGYTALGIMTVEIANASSGGVNCSFCHPYTWRLVSQSTARITVRNTYSAAAKVKGTITVLYVKN